MSVEGNSTLLDLYSRELAYLRERGADFANKYPKVAARLGIARRDCSDPHVERLIEAFAFLTARIQSQLEQDSAVLTTSLLGILYPQYVSPLPSMAIARFNVDLKGGALTSGCPIEKGSVLYAETASQTHPDLIQTCRFRTAYPVVLWPITVADATYVSWEDLRLDQSSLPAGMDSNGPRPVGAIQIRLRSRQSLRGLGIPSLRFYINGDDVEASRVYDLIFERERPALVSQPGRGKPSASCRIRPVGFAPEEDVLPYPAHAQLGHRLIQEYFAFPRKFMFFDVVLDNLPDSFECELIILVDRRPAGVSIRSDMFRLGCTPIVNLFEHLTEPFRVDNRQFEYRLVADVRRERFTQIHSILGVTATGQGEPKQRPFAPFFSFSHPEPEVGQSKVFWTSRRIPSERADLPGSDVLLSFVDMDFQPQKPGSDVVFAKVLCTNRDMPEEMEVGTLLSLELPVSVETIECLTKPTPQIEAPTGGQALWRLVSNLSLNHLSLDGSHGVEALQEILRAYLFRSTPAAERQLAAIVGLKSRTVSGRVSSSGWRGLCRGSQVTLTLDERQFGDASPILMADVLNRFLSLYAHFNSFTELVLVGKSRGEEDVWKKWPPAAGAKPLL